MGTRNLTMVISGEETKVAQYGQWDGYPSGQGATIVNFLRTKSLNKFKKQLEKVRFTTEEDDKKVNEFLKSIGSNDGWMTMKQADLYHEEYPYFTRDHGANILNLIQQSKDKEILLQDSSDFIHDGLFCEWAYVIDIDNMRLEVYRGFYGEEVESGIERRFETKKGEGDIAGKYVTAQPFYWFDLNELPTVNQFVKVLEEKLEKEYENEEDY